MNKNTINKITASWEPIGEMPKIYDNETYKMLKMQKLAYEALKGSSNIIINAPTASGKTLAICWMTAKKLIDNTSLKAIIAVPQTIIADGFRGSFNLHFEETNKSTNWCPRHFLCADNFPETNIQKIEGFLNREGQISDINDRILVCSHASLVDSFQKYPDLFKELVIVVDEAHHISYSEGEEVEDGEGRGAMVFCNQMGTIIATALKNEDKNISLMLSTATLFRGDRLEIIPEKYKDKFETFHYPMDEYLKDCHWLKSFSYDFAMYQGGYKKRMSELFKKEVGKTIVYVPHILSKRYSSGSKLKDWENVYRAIAGKDNYKSKELDNGMTLIKRGSEWIKVVNLVDDSDMTLREKRKDLIIAAHKNKDNSMLDVIIALNMFKEGANWKWADRELIVGTKGSLTDMNQIVGRLFRDAKDKTSIQTVQLLPFSFDQIDKNKFRDNLNSYMKVIFATMLLEEAINPLKIKIPVKNISNGVSNGSVTLFVDYLREAVKDENKIYSIQTAIRNEAIIAQDNGEIDFGLNNEKSRSKFESIVSEVLKDEGVEKYHKEIAQQIHKSWLRESVKTIKGIDLSTVDFETIQVNPLSFILNYTTGMCGLDTFRKFREAVREYCFVSYEEAKEITRQNNIKSQDEYQNWKGRPDNLPSNVEGHYENNGWTNWYDFLGCGKRRSGFVDYETAKNITRQHGISKRREYENWKDRPDAIPRYPYEYYKDKGWINWLEFLGGGMRKVGFLNYEETKAITRKNKIKNQKEYQQWDRPNNVHSNPQVYFKNNGWTNWYDFLGCGLRRTFATYKESKKITMKNKISTQKQYFNWKNRPDELPARPDSTYKNNGWSNWRNFLGTNI